MLYFNDHEPYVAQWLRNLWPGAVVDERGIESVDAAGLARFRQCHFFAGIGGWRYALELAGWPDERPAWTGSCPCQPFSDAGKRMGAADARHLWPEWLRLIAECRPSTIFGEQVESRLGREWLAGVRADLETLGYAVGAADLCAASVGAPHRRQRLYWVADAAGERWRRKHPLLLRSTETGRDAIGRVEASRRGEALRLEHAESLRPARLEEVGRSAWSRAEHRSGSDGKCRRIESGLEPLANGIPDRVGRIRAYGNAVVPQIAAAFVRAFMEAEREIERQQTA